MIGSPIKMVGGKTLDLGDKVLGDKTVGDKMVGGKTLGGKMLLYHGHPRTLGDTRGQYFADIILQTAFPLK